MVIDFHTHILPGIDDGSKNIQESQEMLRESVRQGVELIVATPHFYADQMSIQSFLNARNQAYDKLMKTISECNNEEVPKTDKNKNKFPKILKASEVYFFHGISQAEIKDLTLEKSDILFLEMPYRKWTDKDIREVQILTNKFLIVFVHLERFLYFPGNRKYIEQIIKDNTGIIQINAGSLLKWTKRRKTLELIRETEYIILGSDCHNLHNRKPNIKEGREILLKKMGENYLKEMDEYGLRVLKSQLDV